MFLRLFTIMLITASLKVSAEQVYLDTEVLLSNSGTIGISAKLEIISVTVDYDKEIILISVNNPQSKPVTVTGTLMLYSGCCLAAVAGGNQPGIGELISQAPSGVSMQSLFGFESLSAIMDLRNAEGIFRLQAATIVVHDIFEDNSDRD